MASKITLMITVWDDDDYSWISDDVNEIARAAREVGCEAEWSADTVRGGADPPSSEDDNGGYGEGSYYTHAMRKND
jgi:hypothetical protein